MRLTGHSLGYGAAAYGAVAVYATAAQSVSVKPTSSGGWFPSRRRRTPQEIEQQRIELGILPAPVKKAVEKSARRVINKARVEAGEQFDPLQWLLANQAAEQSRLAYDLHKRDLQFQERYLALVHFLVERAYAQMLEEEEDRQIVMLLMEM